MAQHMEDPHLNNINLHCTEVQMHPAAIHQLELVKHILVYIGGLLHAVAENEEKQRFISVVLNQAAGSD